MQEWELKPRPESKLNPKRELCEECNLVIPDQDIRSYQAESGTTDLPRICEWCAEDM